jgi:hypothetical protein
MLAIVNILGTLTVGLCAFLLLRAYGRVRQRLLLWSGLCFVGLTIDNLALYVDLVILSHINSDIIRLLRIVPGLVALSLLLYGLIWEQK